MPTPLDLIIGPAATLLTDVIDRIFPDKDAQAAQRAELMLKAQQIDAELAQSQLAVNQAEAANNSIFVAGWRPFVGWVCGSAFAYHYVLQPFLGFLMANAGHQVILPAFDMSALSEVLMGMLGLGALRTTEKMGDKGHLPWQK